LYRAPPQLRVQFDAPGFFLVDARLVVFLNGHTIYDGSFKTGFNVAYPFAPGKHVIMTWIEMAATSRNREYTIDVPPEGCVVVLSYSRLWGNFEKHPLLVRPT
jgi:hypothetical protein